MEALRVGAQTGREEALYFPPGRGGLLRRTAALNNQNTLSSLAYPARVAVPSWRDFPPLPDTSP